MILLIFDALTGQYPCECRFCKAVGIAVDILALFALIAVVRHFVGCFDGN